MANFRAITIQSGVLDGINDNQGLIVGSGVVTNSGDLALLPASGSTVATGNLFFNDGIVHGVPGLLFTTSSTKVVANTSVETSLLGNIIGSNTFPANYFTVGKVLRVELFGVMGTTNSGAGNLQLRMKFGSTAVCLTAATNVTTSMSSRRWSFEGFIVCQSVGGSGSFVGNGNFIFKTAAAGAFTSWEAVATTVNNTGLSQVFDVTAKWSVASAANTISCHCAILTVLN